MKFPLLHGGKGTKKNLNGKEKGRVSPPQLAQSCQTFNYENASISSPILRKASLILSCCFWRGCLRDDA